MNLDEHKLNELLKENNYILDDIGMSGAEIRIYEDKVLKITDTDFQSRNEYKMLVALNGLVPVPKVYDFKTLNDKSYLLMYRVEGKLASDEQYLSNPDLLTTILANTLNLLWSEDITQFANPVSLDTKLEIAKYNVDNNLVALNSAEYDTFSDEGFANPRELLNFLIENRPEEKLVLSHGDLTLENIIINDSKLAAIIDLGLCGVGDKYQDIALIFRGLANNLGGVEGINAYEKYQAEKFFEKLEMLPDWEKLRYYLLLDELF